MNEDEEVVVPARRRRAGVKKATTRRRSLAPVATLAGMTGLALTVVIAASALLAAVTNTFAAGVLLGAGTLTVVWGASRSRAWPGQSHQPEVGRSRTADCHRPLWDRPAPVEGRRFPPLPTGHGTTACRKSRYHREM
jgi:hypothetical protein